LVHLDDDCSIDRIGLLEWSNLLANERFKKHMVRGSQRSFILAVHEQIDRA
jgi:hypothetical protein